MTSTAALSTIMRAQGSPQFSDTLNAHMFVTSVIPRAGGIASSSSAAAASGTDATTAAGAKPPSEPRCDSARVRKSLEELSQDIKELEDFISVSEDVMRRERERDLEFYARERRRKMQEIAARKINNNNNNNKENRNPPPPSCPIYSLQSPTYKRGGHHSALRKCKSASSSASAIPSSAAGVATARTTLRQSSVAAMSGHEIRASRSGQDTQELIKSIIRMRNDSVSPAEADVLPHQFGHHSFLDASVSPNTIGKELESNKDSLEMIVIDCAPDQAAVVCGSVVGDGDGVDLTQASATSFRSNAT